MSQYLHTVLDHLNFYPKTFLDILNFLGGATSLDKFLKAYEATEQKGFFPYEWFDTPIKLDYCSLPPFESFFSKLKNCNVLEQDYKHFRDLVDQGYEESAALKN